MITEAEVTAGSPANSSLYDRYLKEDPLKVEFNPTRGSVNFKAAQQEAVRINLEAKQEQPCRVEPDGTVVLKYEAMEAGRPYPFQLNGFWFIGVRSAGANDANIYYVPNDE